MTELASWNDTGTKQAIVEFVETAAREIPPEERVAVFDNDGTLWSEKPMLIELGFILQRLVSRAAIPLPKRLPLRPRTRSGAAGLRPGFE